MMFVAKASLWRDIFRQSYAKVLLKLTFLMQISLGEKPFIFTTILWWFNLAVCKCSESLNIVLTLSFIQVMQ